MMISSYECYGASSVSSIHSSEYQSKQEVKESLKKNKATIESYQMRMEESKRKLEEWEQTILTGLLDTTGASILEVNGRELKLTKPILFSRLTNLLWACRMKDRLTFFTHPGDEENDGGFDAIENSSDKDNKFYSSRARRAINQYNKIINNRQSKLVFISFIRVVFSFGSELYITFTACQNGQSGTYQAVVDDDCFGSKDVNLVLLRHLETDKILAVMSLSGVEEEWEKRFGKNWKLHGSEVVGQDA